MGRTPHNKTALVAAHEWTEKDGVLGFFYKDSVARPIEVVELSL